MKRQVEKKFKDMGWNVSVGRVMSSFVEVEMSGVPNLSSLNQIKEAFNADEIEIYAYEDGCGTMYMGTICDLTITAAEGDTLNYR